MKSAQLSLFWMLRDAGQATSPVGHENLDLRRAHWLILGDHGQAMETRESILDAFEMWEEQ